MLSNDMLSIVLRDVCPLLTHLCTFIIRLQFGEMKTLMATENQVYDMEVDLTNAEILLFADGHSLKVTDGINTTTLVGNANQPGYAEGQSTSARFYQLTRFTQLNVTTIVLVDWGNSCLRLVDRQSLQTSLFVGECGRDGSDLFKEPSALLQDPLSPDTLYVTEWGNNTLHIITISTRTMQTIIQQSTGLYQPICMSFGFFKQSILISNSHYISKYDIGVGHLYNITSNTAGFSDGQLAEAKFYWPKELIPLTPTATLVADEWNNKLRLVDTADGYVTSICKSSGVGGTKDGDVEECKLDSPYSLMVRDGVVYVGQINAIRILPCKWLLNKSILECYFF